MTVNLTSLNLLLLVTAATLRMTGGVLMKLSEGLTRLYRLLLLLAVTYLLLPGQGAGLALVGSVLIFRESLSLPSLFGLPLIVGGVGLLHVSSP